MAVNDVYEITVQGRCRGKVYNNVLHFRETVACTDDIPAKSLSAAFRSAIITPWLGLIAEDTTIDCTYTRRIAPGPGVTYTDIVGEPGTREAQSVPSGAAVIASKYGDTFGASKRGRIYFCGVGESDQEAGQLTEAAAVDWAVFLDVFCTVFSAVGADTGSWRGAIWSNKLLSAIIQTVCFLRTNLGSMRTRRQPPGLIP